MQGCTFVVALPLYVSIMAPVGTMAPITIACTAFLFLHGFFKNQGRDVHSRLVIFFRRNWSIRRQQIRSTKAEYSDTHKKGPKRHQQNSSKNQVNKTSVRKALDEQNWHDTCFVCVKCEEPLSSLAGEGDSRTQWDSL